MNNNPISWYEKYRPNHIDDIIFPDDGTKHLIYKWYNEERIDGNVLFYGRPGQGKTTTIRVLVKKIIKDRGDLRNVDARKVEAIDELDTWLKTVPRASKCKIVVIEEMDQLSSHAISALKKGKMEFYQKYVSYLCATNYKNVIERKDSAIMSRFNYIIRFELSKNNVDQVVERLLKICNSENVNVNRDELYKFVESNITTYGLRELINILQDTYIRYGSLDNLSNISTTICVEDEIVEILCNIVDKVSKNVLPLSEYKRLLWEPITSSLIGEDYKLLISKIKEEEYGLNWEYILQQFYEKVNFWPAKVKIARYVNNIALKGYPSIHILSCLYEVLKIFMDYYTV